MNIKMSQNALYIFGSDAYGSDAYGECTYQGTAGCATDGGTGAVGAPNTGLGQLSFLDNPFVAGGVILLGAVLIASAIALMKKAKRKKA